VLYVFLVKKLSPVNTLVDYRQSAKKFIFMKDGTVASGITDMFLRCFYFCFFDQNFFSFFGGEQNYPRNDREGYR
jgi:hypothetical protein